MIALALVILSASQTDSPLRVQWLRPGVAIISVAGQELPRERRLRRIVRQQAAELRVMEARLREAGK